MRPDVVNTSSYEMRMQHNLLTSNGSEPVSSHRSCTLKDSVDWPALAIASKSFISTPNLTAVA